MRRVLAITIIGGVLASCTTRVAPVATTPTSSATTAAATSTTATTTTSTSTSTTTSTTSTTVPWRGPCGAPAPRPAQYDHVIWIWMENKNRSTVFDSSEAPFMHDLAAACASASNYLDHGIRPSLANYIAATSGSAQGIADDDFPARHPLTVDNLFRQVRASGRVATSYVESMPGNCVLESVGRYAVKHNPAAYYVGGDDRAACQRDDVPFDQFAADLAGDLPAFALIVPDICNDMHDCPVATGDAWLRQVVEPIITSSVYREGRTALFVAFDESQGSGTIPFIAVAPAITPGTVFSDDLDHYALLRTTEDALGITEHLGAAATAASIPI